MNISNKLNDTCTIMCTGLETYLMVGYSLLIMYRPFTLDKSRDSCGVDTGLKSAGIHNGKFSTLRQPRVNPEIDFNLG